MTILAVRNRGRLLLFIGRLAMPGRLLDPSEHPKKEIRAVLVRLVKDGWTIRQAADDPRRPPGPVVV